MRAGQLRHRIELQRNEPADTRLAEKKAKWTTYAKGVAANVQPLQGREYVAMQQIKSDTTVRITMRYRAGVEAKHRVKFGSKILDIESVINVDERNRELQLMCREGKP